MELPPPWQSQHLHLHDELEEEATRIAELDGTPATRIRQDNSNLYEECECDEAVATITAGAVDGEAGPHQTAGAQIQSEQKMEN